MLRHVLFLVIEKSYPKTLFINFLTNDDISLNYITQTTYRNYCSWEKRKKSSWLVILIYGQTIRDKHLGMSAVLNVLKSISICVWSRIILQFKVEVKRQITMIIEINVFEVWNWYIYVSYVCACKVQNSNTFWRY